jgi:hypothetical protein
LAGGIYGASLGGTIWSATHKEKAPSQTYDFDVLQNQVSSEAMIPIIYGTRKWGGYQTWHDTSTDKQTLTKDVVMCEGEIGGMTELKANDLYIETKSITTTTNILNIIYTGSSSIATIETIMNASTEVYYLILKENNEVVVRVRLGHSEIPNIATVVNTINSYPGWSATTDGSGRYSIWDIDETNVKNLKYTKTFSTTTVTQQGLDGCSVETHNGSPWQAPPSNYNVVGGYKNCA